MFREIGDSTILLRPLESADAPAMYEAVRESIASLVPWMPWCHEGYALAESQEWIRGCRDAWQTRTEFSFAIIDVRTNSLLGVCGLNFIDWASLRANLGYWVRTTAAGRGIATSAARLLAQYAFGELGLERLEIVAAVGNQASQQVAIKLGAQCEALARRRIRLRDVQHDALVFSLIRDDIPLDCGS